MAEKLETYDWPAGRTPNTKYDKYFDGNIYRLTLADLDAKNLRGGLAKLYSAKKRLGLPLRTSKVDDQTLIVQSGV